MSRERVAIVKVTEQRLDEALQRLMNLLGGLERIVPRNSRVLIKPNFVFAPTDRGITHPELVEAVVRLVAQTAPQEIVIAEGSADNYTTHSFRFQGMSRVAARYGAKLVDLNLEDGVKTLVPEGLGRPHLMLPKVVVESDVLISIPVFKLWGDSPLSLSLKNLFGLYGGRYYGYNKDSDVRGRELSFYGLPGEVGVELGAHKPTVPQSICAMNSVVKTHLAIIDALEGGDGKGNFMRLDTLIAGRNPLATDTIALEMTGLKAAEHETFKLCAERGLGPCRSEEIEVVGEVVEDVAFDLYRLRDGVLQMPLPFCLDLLSRGELLQIQRALVIYGFLPEATSAPSDREELLDTLASVLGRKDYFEKALAECSKYALALMRLIAERGGTSGSMPAIEEAFCERWGEGGLYYMPSARTLARLGLAYAVEGDSRSYYLLPEGVIAALKKF